jgi:ATP-binding cassette subfamily B multidrug efflux pump
MALLGGLAIVNNVTGIPLGPMPFQVGIIVSFLLYSKSFTQPIGQVAQQQLNVIAMALAGATRIFDLIDAPSEVDDGYVELVQCQSRCRMANRLKSRKHQSWAWKHPHKDGTPTTYVWLKGKIDFYDVDFAYVKGKTVFMTSPLRQTRPESRFRWTDRRWQNDDHELDQPFLRYRGWQDSL